MPASSLSSSVVPPHWVIPYAASLSEPCVQALPHLDRLPLPHLRRLLEQLRPLSTQAGDEYALSMPHERVLATTMNWPLDDGHQPWASWWARQDGLTLDPDKAWGLLSPGHWLMGRDHLTLLDPESLDLSPTASQALMEAIRPLFEEDGWTLLWGAPTRWYAAHPTLEGLPTASLDRVVGRNPDVWLTDHPQARTLRRLQSEVQMLLYQHPINDEREASGLPSVNSFWLSGVGRPPQVQAVPEHIHVCPQLRTALLTDDMPSWLEAWTQLDRDVLGPLCERLDREEPFQLTLCGERQAVTLATVPAAGWVRSCWQGIQRLWRPKPLPLSSHLRAL